MVDEYAGLYVETENPWVTIFGRMPKNPALLEVPIDNLHVVKAEGTFKFFQRALKAMSSIPADVVWNATALLGEDVLKLSEKQFVKLSESTDWIFCSVRKSQRNLCLLAEDPGLMARWLEVMCQELTPSQIKRMDALLTYEMLRNISPFKEAGYKALIMGPGSEDSTVAAAKLNSAEKVYRRLLNAHDPYSCRELPDIRLSEGEYRLCKLPRMDPTGLFLGLWTNCCQHPMGVGKFCSWYGYLMSDSGFYVVEHHGKIIAQSWAWAVRDKVVFDNIEALDKSFKNPHILSLFRKAAQEFINLGYSQVNVGMGFMEIEALGHQVCPDTSGFIAPSFSKIPGLFPGDAIQYTDAVGRQCILAKREPIQWTALDAVILEDWLAEESIDW